MATTTPNLGLPRPEGSDYVTRANYVELIDTIDEKVASVSELDAHVNDKNNPHGVTPEQIGAETPAGAQAKASAAEQAAKEYTDQKIAAIPEPPVTSVNNKTGAVVLTKSDIGLGSVDNVRQATKSEFDAHVENTNNPHGVTKAQVGLGNVQNYGIATQAEARAGTSNSKYMTPLRTKEAITALTGGVPLRVNNGMLEYNDGSGWKLVGSPVLNMEPKHINYYVWNIRVPPSSHVDLVNINGSGIIYPFEVYVNANTNDSALGISIVLDGTEFPLYYDNSGNARRVTKEGGDSFWGSTSTSRRSVIRSDMIYRFNTNFTIRINNVHDSYDPLSVSVTISGGYYTW